MASVDISLFSFYSFSGSNTQKARPMMLERKLCKARSAEGINCTEMVRHQIEMRSENYPIRKISPLCPLFVNLILMIWGVEFKVTL